MDIKKGLRRNKLIGKYITDIIEDKIVFLFISVANTFESVVDDDLHQLNY